MLLLSTKPTVISILNLAKHHLNEIPPRVQEAETLVRMIPTDKISWDIRLRMANIFLNNGQITQAKSLIAVIDINEYFYQAVSAGQVNLLFNVLIRTDKNNEALLLLESKKNAERFSEFDNMDISLRVINALLIEGKINEVQNLICEINIDKYFEQVVSVGQANLLLSVLIKFDLGEKVLFLINSSDFVAKFNDIDSIELKLYIANEFIKLGKRAETNTLLSNIDLGSLSSAIHFERLGAAFMRIYCFKKAIDIYNSCEKKDISQYKFHVKKAMSYRCQWQYDNALKCLKKSSLSSRLSQGEPTANTIWMARLFNLTGRHRQSYKILNKYNTTKKISTGAKSSLMYEKGFSLRSLGKFDESLECFKYIIKLNRSDQHWLLISYFEYSLTLFFKNRFEDAKKQACLGMKIKTSILSDKQNPCKFLFFFFENIIEKKYDKHKYDEIINDFLNTWVYPQFPYDIWAILLTFTLKYRQNDFSGAKEALKILFNKQFDFTHPIVSNLNKFVINDKKNELNSKININLLGNIIWPYHLKESYERNIINKLVYANVDGFKK